MKRRMLVPLKSFRILSLKIRFFITVLVFLCSCSARTQDSLPPDIARLFTDAGLPLLKEKLTPRDFSLPLASAPIGPVSLDHLLSLSSFSGKVVLLNFWATWCGPCRSEMPSMEALYNRFKNRGLEILAVNCGERSQDVLAFVNDYGLSFPTVMDNDGKVSGIYGIRAIPASYLIDRDGKIIMRVVGSLDWDSPKINAAFERLLN